MAYKCSECSDLPHCFLVVERLIYALNISNDVPVCRTIVVERHSLVPNLLAISTVQDSELLKWIWDRVKVDRFVDTDVNILVSLV